jgi:TonB family protein
MLSEVGAAAKKFDSHLVIALTRLVNGELELRIGPGLTPGSVAALASGGSSAMFRSGAGAGIGAGIGGGIGGASSAGQSAPAPSTTQPGVYQAGNGVSPPSVLYKADPVFPDDAGANQTGGTVILSCVIGGDGKTEEIHVVKSLGMGFDANAIDAVSKWVFKPGMRNGVPVPVRATIEVNFRRLQGQGLQN